MSSDLLQSLNPRQLQAVTAPEKSVLILAGAGSGKTRVLTTRIAWLLSEHKAQTGDILAVTFTNKAAKEMLVRLEAILPYDLRRMWVGTFHGLCNRILRTHAQDAGLPKTFQILDSSDQLSMVKRVMKALNIDTESYDPRQVANVINWYKENGMRASHAAGQQGGDETAVKVYQAYEQQCQREGVVDFAELLLRCYELLDRNEIVRSHYQNRFRHILVDEFQDTNVLQYRWLQMLAGFGRGPGGAPMNAVFAVGDDDQSIYAFRGANVGNMSDFLRDFGVEEPIRLEENYRSTGTILDAANALIAHNSNRLGKNLWTSGSRGDRICVAELDDDRAEAEWIAREIEADRSRGRAWRDHAILYRANAQSRALESAFAARGIPYRIYGGQRFFERAEVKHVLAYLRLMDNPGDDTSFQRVVNFPLRGIGARTIETLAEEAAARGLTLFGTLFAPDYKVPPKLAAFRELIMNMREEADSLSLQDTIKLVIVRSGLEAHYNAEKDGEDRIANMREMMSAAAGYIANEGLPDSMPAFRPADEGGQTPLQGFLTQATLKDERGPGVSEERRLMYVAITRAKQRLVITYCKSRMQYGEYRRNEPSSFLDEIPEQLVDNKDLTAEAQGYRSSYGGQSRASGYGWERPSFGGSRGGERSYGRSSSSSRSWSSSSSSRGGSSSYGSSRSSASQDKDDWRRGLSGAGGTYRSGEDPVVKKAAARAAGSTFGYEAGDKVEHKKFGRGVIESITGSGNDARVYIRFNDVGRKELLLALAAKNMQKK